MADMAVAPGTAPVGSVVVLESVAVIGSQYSSASVDFCEVAGMPAILPPFKTRFSRVFSYGFVREVGSQASSMGVAIAGTVAVGGAVVSKSATAVGS